MRISNGWAEGAERRLSPNFQQGHDSRECIVLHYTAGYTADSAIATFASASTRASAHFVVATDGAVTQMVGCNDTAWHAGFGLFRGAGRVNRRSIGIEIVNPGYHFRTASGEMLNWERKPVPESRLAPFPGLLEARDPWVGAAAQFWPLYPEPQLLAVEHIISACIRAWPAITDILGHRDIDTVRRRKVDPGPAFPMQRIRRLLPDRAEPAELGGRALLVRAPGTMLNIRGGPGEAFEKLGAGPLADGQAVTELESRGAWVRVRVGYGRGAFEGWCHGGWLRPA